MTGTLDHTDTPTSNLIARDDAHTSVVWPLLSGTTRLVLVTGPAGIGRTALLNEVRDTLEHQRVRTADVPLLRADRNRPQAVVARVREELARWSRPPVLFLDDLHRLNHDVLRALLDALPQLATCVVGSYRTPVRLEHTDLADALKTSALTEIVPLTPLNRSEVSLMFTGLLNVSADPDLARRLHKDSRGVPGLVDLAVDGYLRGGALRIIDRTAYLVDEPRGTGHRHPAVERIRLLGEAAWQTAKAMAILHPLGPAAEQLLGDTRGLPELEAEGVLTRHDDGYRFRAPVLAHALAASLGPYERHDLGWRAVSAIWEGRAFCANPSYLPDRLIDAGGFADAEKACNQLLAAGKAVVLHDPSARRWLRAAADRATTPTQQAEALFMHAVACASHNDFVSAMASVEAALELPDEFTPDQMQEMHLIRLVGMCAAGDRAALRKVADGSWRSLPGGTAARFIGRAVAMCYTDRWDEAATLLASTRGMWRLGNAATVTFGELFGMSAALMSGRMADFERVVSDPGLCPLFAADRNRPALQAAMARCLMLAGEMKRAQRMLVGQKLEAADLALLQAADGRWDEALGHARKALVTGSTLGQVAAHTALAHDLATMLVTRAKLARAREVIADARAGQNVLPHLLDVPESDLELVLGARDKSRRALQRGLAFASQYAIVIGTDELEMRLAVMSLEDGDREDAEFRVERLADIAETMDTGRAHRNHLLARAVTWHDKQAAAEVRRIVTERDQPHEIALTLTALASHGLGDARTLREAYELFGIMDALLPRALLRHMMREHGVAVPGRSATTAEQERLLACLVAEGLTNRELAGVLRTTEKSVEAKLTRLFQRTGYRSRVELATAMLTGEYH
ncbi:LuxR C-terminal-related transcriptional regulator [Lentzea sp. NPDC051838]|uniref:LuxR C-terminal-related transcriptional regulator n=1 Tax=Lentzea sp. NPDC051838 TaxID=3154849 RepID=UPI0034232436